ncbi:MAG TPA: addiction module protein [Opitutales bacterium]|jgi:hypothetical protein|nr:addiction module protein [Opitutales bacterium]
MTASTLARMSKAEKLQAMEALWVDLSSDEASFESPAWHATALAEAETLVKSGKARFIDWESAKKQLAKRRK